MAGSVQIATLFRLVEATLKSQTNMVPMPTVAWTRL